MIQSKPKETLLQILTKRQFEVAGLVAKGLTDKEIGAELGIADGTVAHMVYEAMDRVQVSKRILLATRYVLERREGYYEGT